MYISTINYRATNIIPSFVGGLGIAVTQHLYSDHTMARAFCKCRPAYSEAKQRESVINECRAGEALHERILIGWHKAQVNPC